MYIGVKKILYVETIIGFLVSGGAYLIMLLAFFFMGYKNGSFSVAFTKLLLVTLTFYYIIHHKPKPRFAWNAISYLFCIFFALWFLRVFYDSYIALKPLTYNCFKYYQYAVFYSIVPFIYGNLTKDNRSMEKVLNGLIWGSVMLSLAIFVLFFDVLSDMRRLGYENQSINPLAIGYVAAMNISYFTWKSIIGKIKISYILIILVNIPVFAMGASRGALVALIISLLVVISITRKVNWKVGLFIGMFFIFAINSEKFGLNILSDRIQSKSEQNSLGEKETRYYLWAYSIDKFMKAPLFGYSVEIIEHETFYIDENMYPHNIILESFLSMGVLGGGIMLLLVGLTLKRVIFIYKNGDKNILLIVFFLVALCCNMFSGSLYYGVGTTWFWAFLGLINGRYSYLNHKVSI